MLLWVQSQSEPIEIDPRLYMPLVLTMARPKQDVAGPLLGWVLPQSSLDGRRMEAPVVLEPAPKR